MKCLRNKRNPRMVKRVVWKVTGNDTRDITVQHMLWGLSGHYGEYLS